MKKILLGIIVFLLVVLFGYCQDQPLQLTIKSDKQIYEVEEDITIFFKLQNVSDKTISFYHSERPELFAISVKKEDGTHCNIEGLQLIEPKVQLVSLKSGETLEYSERGEIVRRMGHLCDGSGKFGNKPEVKGIFVEFSASPSAFLGNGNDSYLIDGHYENVTSFRTYYEQSQEEKSYDQFLLENQDKWRGNLLSSTITIKVVEKKLSKEEIITIAKTIPYKLEKLEAIYDEENQMWKREWDRRRNYFKNLPKIWSPLVGKNYQAVYFSPKKEEGLLATGVWVFIDRGTGKVIEFQEEAN